MKLSFKVDVIDCKTAKAFIHKHHYSKGSHNGPSPNFGLFDGEKLIGVAMIANPCSENVKKFIFGLEHKNTVRELHRLALLDEAPKNSESYFLSRCYKLLAKIRPDLWAIVSFSDTTIGHNGVIYQATNHIYYGKSEPRTFYLDGSRLRHPRQNGRNISKKEAISRGWVPVKRQSKNRYLYLLGDKRKRRNSKRLLKVPIEPYPHNGNVDLMKPGGLCHVDR